MLEQIQQKQWENIKSNYPKGGKKHYSGFEVSLNHACFKTNTWNKEKNYSSILIIFQLENKSVS